MDAGKKKQKITVLITENFKGLKVPTAKLNKLVKTICSKFKISMATVSISIVDDAGIRQVNKKFFSRTYTTDCVSFDLSDNTKISGMRLFDIVVNGRMAVRQARLRGHSSQAELALYVTHGLLHNLGFDDMKLKAAKKMHKAEDEILQQLGYGIVYNKPTKTG